MITTTLVGTITQSPYQEGDHIRFSIEVRAGFGAQAPSLPIPVRKFGTLGRWESTAKYILPGRVMTFTGELIVQQQANGMLMVTSLDLLGNPRFVPRESPPQQPQQAYTQVNEGYPRPQQQPQQGYQQAPPQQPQQAVQPANAPPVGYTPDQPAVPAAPAAPVDGGDGY
jgi:hypothetical protein